MEQPSSSSQVTVEYHDPYGVFPLLAPGLLDRLPLRNLHWESHTGPLRSIDALHVEFVRSGDVSSVPYASNPSAISVKSSETVNIIDEARSFQASGGTADDELVRDPKIPDSRSTVKGRRHQIPGLRETPYLKVHFLRCDDPDTYKSQCRKQIREWIREHTPPSQSTTKTGAQDNHDAFEWMIVHVVIPNTPAASQPRVSSKGSSTILEKLRADFNGTSKTAVDRIAQVRIGINDVTYDMLPRITPATTASYNESQQENTEAWLDLIGKLKYLILTSFDLRVGQYEEDIREKDAQRTLPGWNFCTFFMLKEGLARGFESVGLLEDALVGYDELAVGFSAMVAGHAISEPRSDHTSSFLRYTEELRVQLGRNRIAILEEHGIRTQTGDAAIESFPGTATVGQDEVPVNAARKQYRDLILANNISVFDLKCYIFARQLSLLLRMANAWSSREELLTKLKAQRESIFQGIVPRQSNTRSEHVPENLYVLAEICRRALDFIASVSRTMRVDLEVAYLQLVGGDNKDAGPDSSSMDACTQQMIDNMVSSFAFSVAQQVLAQTATKALPIPSSPTGYLDSNNDISSSGGKIPEPEVRKHPTRTSSLISQQSQRSASPDTFPGRTLGMQGDGKSRPDSTFLKAGLEDLAAYRAHLYLLSRHSMERISRYRDWDVGYISSTREHNVAMEDVDLNSKAIPHQAETAKVSPSLLGVDNNLLRVALEKQDHFYRLYETLTDKALRHFSVAGHSQSAQSGMADLAVLKFQLRDYAAAASYFHRMAPFFGEEGWDDIELRMLVMYSKCLKVLKRDTEYVRVGLKLLERAAAAEKARLERRREFKTGRDTYPDFEEEISIDGHLTDLMRIIPTLEQDITLSIETFFSGIEIEDSVRYLDEEDGFALEMKLAYLLPDVLEIEKVRCQMKCLTGRNAGHEIWLESSESFSLRMGMNGASVHSKTIIPGTYVVNQVVLQAKRLVLSYESTAVLPTSSTCFLKSHRFLIYERPNSLGLSISASRCIHLDWPRSLEIQLSTGWNSIQSGELHIRAATAGLRLQTGGVTLVEGGVDLPKRSEPGIIGFGAIHASSNVNLSLPFTLEQEVKEISLKLTFTYTTGKGTFLFVTNATVSTALPLGVNVQDVFKHHALFSKFSVTTSTPNPLYLLKSSLDNSETLDASRGRDINDPIMIFSGQPASLVYKIVRKPASKDAAEVVGKRKTSLDLTLYFLSYLTEIDNILSSILTTALQGTEFCQYTRLVVPTVLSQLHTRLSSYDVERTVVTGMLHTSILADVRWRDCFAGLGRSSTENKDTAVLLEEWLRGWGQKTSLIRSPSIQLSKGTLERSQSIIVPVEVPCPTVVFIADIKLSKGAVVRDGELHAVTGQPLAGSLEIKWTREWNSTSKSASESLVFEYELSAAHDTWVIGGRRKGQFQLSHKDESMTRDVDDKRFTFPIILIPANEGYLSFPQLEIRPLHMTTGKEQQGEAMEKRAEVTFEVDYKNIGELVRVLSNSWKTTVSLDATGPQGEARLLESERRQDNEEILTR